MIKYLNELGKGETVSSDENYYEFVQRLFKPGEFADQLIHATLGISGEAGELVDSVKKTVFYNRPLDRENFIEELGDLEFYMQALRNLLGIPRDQILQANMDKLNKRYASGGFSSKEAQERADKNEMEAGR